MQVSQLNYRNNYPQQRQNSKEQLNNHQQKFGGAFDCVSLALRFLDTNQAWGATAVDVGSMVLPRTIVDFQRGVNAGVETATRESSSSANHALVGVYGTLAGLMLASTFNSKFGIKFNKIFAGDKILDNLGESWHEEVQSGNKNPLRKHLEKVVGSIEGFNPSGSKEGWVGIPKDTQKLIVDRLENDITSSNKAKISKETERYIHSLITSSTGAEAKMRLLKKGKEHVSGLDLKTMLENIYSVTKTFTSEKVGNVFETTKDFSANDFIKSMKKFNKMRSLMGIGIAGAIGMSIQPINRYITKRRTGEDKFVGGGEKDNSFGFKIRKALAAVVFGTGAFACISTNPKEIIPRLQFKGMIPSLNQFKAIYGLTIMSRFMAARNDNELIESSVKDIFGFVNWLILGSVVSKGVANSLDKDLINIKDGDGKGFFKWLKNSSIKTRDEVLLSSLKNAGVDVVKDGKALTYSEMLKKIPANDKLTKVKLRKLNIAQVAGYLYSGLVLGIGIPKLNAYMTNKRIAKQAAAQESAKAQSAAIPENDQTTVFFKEQLKMKTFLSGKVS